MQYPGYTNGEVVLSEGSRFLFKIHNLLQLQDHQWYYVLIDINGLKHFLPAEFYKNYNFKIGDEIICCIDKINCTGRIFLEPKHPYYDEGEIYTFKVNSCIEHDAFIIVIVIDIFNNCIEIVLKKSIGLCQKDKKAVHCLVKNIKKGIPILDIYSEYP